MRSSLTPPQAPSRPLRPALSAIATAALVIDPSLAYSTYLGGSSVDDGHGIAVDSQGAAYVTGTSDSTDFPTTAGAFDASNAGGFGDVVVTKFNPAGSLTYSTYLGGSGRDDGLGIAVDSAGAAYVTGATRSTDLPTTAGAFDTDFNGAVSYPDAFIAKLDATGSGLEYSTDLAGASTTASAPTRASASPSIR